MTIILIIVGLVLGQFVKIEVKPEFIEFVQTARSIVSEYVQQLLDEGKALLVKRQQLHLKAVKEAAK